MRKRKQLSGSKALTGSEIYRILAARYGSAFLDNPKFKNLANAANLLHINTRTFLGITGA